MNPEHVELLERLTSYEVTEPNAEFPFSVRLARDNGWSPTYTRRAIKEYKRFAFLAVVAGHPVSPSEAVDQVWHEHLIYTQTYWKDFCGQVLRTPLHHHPTKGGTAEGAKFREWYARTLASYEQFFGESAPADLWPDPRARFASKERFCRVNLNHHWVIPKPCWREWLTKAKAAGALLRRGGLAFAQAAGGFARLFTQTRRHVANGAPHSCAGGPPGRLPLAGARIHVAIRLDR